MTSAIAKRQQDLSDRAIASYYQINDDPSIAHYIEAISKSLQH